MREKSSPANSCELAKCGKIEKWSKIDRKMATSQNREISAKHAPQNWQNWKSAPNPTKNWQHDVTLTSRSACCKIAKNLRGLAWREGTFFLEQRSRFHFFPSHSTPLLHEPSVGWCREMARDFFDAPPFRGRVTYGELTARWCYSRKLPAVTRFQVPTGQPAATRLRGSGQLQFLDKFCQN